MGLGIITRRGEPPRKGVDKYKVLSFVQSTGEQWVDSRYKPNQNTRVVCDFAFEAVSDNQYLFCARGASGGYANRFGLLQHTSGYFRSDYNNGNLNFPTGIALDGRHTVDFNGQTCSIDGQTVTHAVATFSSSYNMFFFAGNTGGRATEMSSVKIYTALVYDNSTFVRDLVGVKDIDTGEVGLYDRVNHEFYPNMGTGEFIAGEETGEIIKEYAA